MTILASLVGSAASIRQILLHIVPPDPGYGPPILGVHLYSWALVFACLIAFECNWSLRSPRRNRAAPKDLGAFSVWPSS